MENQRSRWQLQLSIRTLLELTAAVAVVLGFWFTRGSGADRFQIVTSEHHGVIIYDPAANKCWQFIQDGGKNSWYPFDGPPELGK